MQLEKAIIRDYYTEPVQELNSRVLHKGMNAFYEYYYTPISTRLRVASGLHRQASMVEWYMVESNVPCTCSTWKLEQVVLNYMRSCHSTKVFPKTKYTISKERGERGGGGRGGGHLMSLPNCWQCLLGCCIVTFLVVK